MSSDINFRLLSGKSLNKLLGWPQPARFLTETFNMTSQIHESVFNLPIYLGSFAYCDLCDQNFPLR